jgi:5-methylcytosine-specific restriction protein B
MFAETSSAIGQTMRAFRGQTLPLDPLLRAYGDAGLPSREELADLPEIGTRVRAILAAQQELLAEAFLDNAPAADFLAALLRFYQSCVQPALHTETLQRRAGIVRHALGYIRRCTDPLPRKLDNCLATWGSYRVAGLGPTFWSALLQGLDPQRHAAWTPSVVTGLQRLGLLPARLQDTPGAIYAAIFEAYQRIRARRPELSALHVDHFLTLVAAMQGRDLGTEPVSPSSTLATILHQERARLPLRPRLKARGAALQDARRRLEGALAVGDGPELGAALAIADPAGAQRSRIDWHRQAAALTHWVGRLWESAHPEEILEAFWRCDPIPRAGLWLPAAVLHLKDPQRFPGWDEATRQGYATLDDSANLGESGVERYRLFQEAVNALCEHYRIHPFEIPSVLAALAGEAASSKPETTFGGFCSDTFRFLAELSDNNRRDWMEPQRERYRFAVREPLIELCRALAERYVEPVLCRVQGWDLETAARSSGALTSVCKNDYGRSVPYHTVLWITFRRRGQAKRTEAQFFVRLDAAGLSYGLRLGRAALEAARLLRQNVQEHAVPLCRALVESGGLSACHFGNGDDTAAALTPTRPEDLVAWAAGTAPVAARTIPTSAPLLRNEALVGDILLTFDRLLPLYICAVEPDPLPRLLGRGGVVSEDRGFTEKDFSRATFLDDDWIRRARELLALKSQLILQGVPGTGKTHVARCLAQLLTRGHEEAVRLVQFHPAYSYEEFVEGIKVRTVEVNGRHDVTYLIEDGILCAFAAQAASRPSEPHVLIVDEINRGNLPRIFGELLYLLEYREQSLLLPYSKRSFRLPANLYLLGTMNGADRSVALVDQALRRRFSFLDMPPDAAVLSAWLQAYPPPADQDFAATIVALFERLNACLRNDLGPAYQIGHSYFMVPDLDEARLRVVWEHHVRPLLEEYFAGHTGQMAGYELDQLLHGERRRTGERRRRAAGASRSR